MGLRDFLKKAEKNAEETKWEDENPDGGLNIDLDAAAKAIKAFKNRKQ